MTFLNIEFNEEPISLSIELVLEQGKKKKEKIGFYSKETLHL